jgi:hypothetical protein
LALMRRSDLEASRPEEDRYAFEREGAAALYSVERKKGRARCEGYRLLACIRITDSVTFPACDLARGFVNVICHGFSNPR